VLAFAWAAGVAAFAAERMLVELFFCMAIVSVCDAPNLSASDAGTLT
jgi:hypothetical protein